MCVCVHVCAWEIDGRALRFFICSGIDRQGLPSSFFHNASGRAVRDITNIEALVLCVYEINLGNELSFTRITGALHS